MLLRRCHFSSWHYIELPKHPHSRPFRDLCKIFLGYDPSDTEVRERVICTTWYQTAIADECSFFNKAEQLQKPICGITKRSCLRVVTWWHVEFVSLIQSMTLSTSWFLRLFILSCKLLTSIACPLIVSLLFTESLWATRVLIPYQSQIISSWFSNTIFFFSDPTCLPEAVLLMLHYQYPA